MRKAIYFLFAITAVFATFALKAQTADEIVSKYLDAIGGKDKIKQVTSLYMEGSTQMMGSDNPTVITIVDGKGYKSETEFNGQKIVQCFTDKGGWSINPMGGGAATPMPDEAYNAGKGQIFIGGSLFDYAAKGTTVEMLGKDGANYKLKVITKEKTEATYFIDATTYYISKVMRKGNMGGREVDITITFSDYKKTDFGFVIAYTTNIDLGQFQLASSFKKVEINKAIDPAVFNMPK